MNSMATEVASVDATVSLCPSVGRSAHFRRRFRGSSRAPPAVQAWNLMRHGQFHVIATARSSPPAENRFRPGDNHGTMVNLKQ